MRVVARVPARARLCAHAGALVRWDWVGPLLCARARRRTHTHEHTTRKHSRTHALTHSRTHAHARTHSLASAHKRTSARTHDSEHTHEHPARRAGWLDHPAGPPLPRRPGPSPLTLSSPLPLAGAAASEALVCRTEARAGPVSLRLGPAHGPHQGYKAEDAAGCRTSGENSSGSEVGPGRSWQLARYFCFT